MKRYSYLLAVAIVAISSVTQAQYASDALRFSQTEYGTTSRFKAMGGAQIGIGGDLSSISGNPAGLGLFTKTEVSITPGLFRNSNTINYLGQNTTSTSSNPALSQAAVAMYLPVVRRKGSNPSQGLVSLVVGLGYNRTADYQNDFWYMGKNSQTSMADYFAELGGSTLPANLGTGSLEKWAYQDYLISYDAAGKYYFPETYVPGDQSSTEAHTGGISEFNFSMGVNISNQVYVGANLNLVSLEYNRNASFTESGMAREYNGGVLTGTQANYKFIFNQNQTSTGEGISGRLGLIYRPVSEFRFGATIQTPTWMEVTDYYKESLDNRGSTNGTNNNATYSFVYRLRTPFKASLGASYVIGGSALLTGDLDYVDYSSTRLSTSYSSGTTVTAQNNATIRSNYTEAVNFRVGGEYKLNNLSVRAGYGYNGSPYKNKSELNTQLFTAGLGYRIMNFYLDGAFQHRTAKNTYSPYTLANFTEPVANISTNKNNIYLTAGIRF